MSTTRHLVNRQRRLASAHAARTTTRSPAEPDSRESGSRKPEPREPKSRGREPKSRGREPAGPSPAPPRRNVLPAALGVLTVLLGGFAAWAGSEASALRDEPAVRNAALTDIARTSEVKGQITKAVDAVFSYNYADPATADRAVKAHLTGKAVEQHRRMLAPVREQAARQKLVLTTTVTESGVEQIDGDRARVLVYADQSNTRTAAAKDRMAYGAAMFAVEAVRKDGMWRIAAIDTLGAGS